MHNNRFLLVFCSLLIVIMGFLRTIDTDNKALLAQVSESDNIYPRLDENNSINTIPESVLISDDTVKQSIKGEDIVKEEKKIAPRPDISVESYLIGNLETGEVYMSKNSNAVFPIASLTKLFTALVVHKSFNTNNLITITQSILDTYGDAGHLVLNEKFLPNELIYPLIIESSNDAAQAFPEYFGVDTFIKSMNLFAGEIGMSNTSFKDSSGLSPQNVSNASDLFIFAQYLYKNEKDLLEISHIKEMTMNKNKNHEDHKFININPYSNYAGFIGGKTGRTEWAKESMVSLFNQNIYGVNFPIAIIILRSDMGQREINTEKLLGKFIEMVDVK